MPQTIEVYKDNFTISTDPSRLDMDAICDFLTRSYWAQGRPRERTKRAFANSLVFGLYDANKQIGMARVISDYTIVAYLCDVFIHEEYRGRGLGKWLLETMLDHPDLRNVRRWLLATSDAHELYRQFGWDSLHEPENWMERFRPFPEEGLRS
jgi:GNAT superfamily N-acetyltransferase